MNFRIIPKSKLSASISKHQQEKIVCKKLKCINLNYKFMHLINTICDPFNKLKLNIEMTFKSNIKLTSNWS